MSAPGVGRTERHTQEEGAGALRSAQCSAQGEARACLPALHACMHALARSAQASCTACQALLLLGACLPPSHQPRSLPCTKWGRERCRECAWHSRCGARKRWLERGMLACTSGMLPRGSPRCVHHGVGTLRLRCCRGHAAHTFLPAFMHACMPKAVDHSSQEMSLSASTHLQRSGSSFMCVLEQPASQACVQRLALYATMLAPQRCASRNSELAPLWPQIRPGACQGCC